MTWRARFVHGMCQQVNWNTTLINGRTPVFFFSKPTGLLACKAPKTGSTLLGALVRAINLPSEKNVSNVFQLGRNTIHDGMDELRGLTSNLLRETSLRVMVTRDPYSRLYSAFIDKYFLLGRLGRELAAYLKHGFKEVNDSYCGYDVTFQEFLDYVVYLAQNKVEMNEHMVPIAQLCDVCSMRYDLICRQEHLTQGTEEILKMITNLSRDRLGTIRKSLKSQQTSLLSLVASHIFDYNYNRQDCPNKLYFSAKMWKTFQIQGLVHSDLDFHEHVFSPFSFTDKEASNMTSAILQVIQSKPLTKEGRKRQRMKYLSEAYRDIRWQTIVNLQKVYQLDILLFGYSSYPPNVPMSWASLTN
ncbi:carbohydrate sulfotransferase 10-like isoform X1 [Pecten maximus]|uniref:carbohydrate sulfotransferase 10-like isoform X1 n=1 Tax=Pecten maximus TaxID=6579 RepID=UPI00145845C6|nr:carbohydrate sulfotransferase 10-like isoform X1 [Pecten maximus]XP_033754906.1 carbohydrate sulfotransferase 10-like isoform X1 [Pecten maximus]XP_033754907.1 carbohydrate sulfotransferase 10-like isoform X1 [Pecten maximus]XP_033754908.1 carbohydrate sulfotransferase 10-like isoform X1 [Pecten maximus]